MQRQLTSRKIFRITSFFEQFLVPNQISGNETNLQKKMFYHYLLGRFIL
jgi:hypothetical protein